MNTFITKYAVIAIIVALLVLIFQGELLSPSPWVITGQVIGLAVVLSGRAAFRGHQFRASAEPGSGPLVRTGPYRYVRHPIYSGVLLFLWASILGHLSILNAALGLIALAVVMARVSVEERFLRSHYPEYEEYARKSKRLIPFVY
jgi:protein-S-isoprenylcysteine O-methyltransferase Ste14